MPESGSITATLQVNNGTLNSRGQVPESWQNVTGVVSITAKFRLRNPNWSYDKVGGGNRQNSTGIVILEPPISAAAVAEPDTHRWVLSDSNWKIVNVRLYERTQQFDVEQIAGVT